MQTILGAGGDIGTPLAKELKQYTRHIRLVARNPKRVNEDDELFKADLTNAAQVSAAVKGSEVVYLVAGLPYDHRIWQQQWPVIIQNVVDACVEHGSKLVFLDNVYMYAPSAIPHMTEESPVVPVSAKGKVRQKNVEIIREAIEKRGLKALFARSADFYGPGARNGILNMLVIDPFSKGKKAQWQSDANKVHTFTYTPDAAKATAMLGNADHAYNQVWHLPTSAERLTGKQYVELTASLTGAKASYMVLSPFLLRLAGLFNRTIKELVEMQYQNNQDYFFDSSKFNKAFGFTPTGYKEGIGACLNTLKK